MEAKVHHIAFVSAKELVKDGYHVAGFGYDEKKAESRYNLVHENGNKMAVVSVEAENTVYIYKNNRLNKTIKL